MNPGEQAHWVAEVAGRHEEWDAEITEQHPDERIAWRSTRGARNAGVVTFHRLSDDRTKIMLQLDAEPEGVVECVHVERQEAPAYSPFTIPSTIFLASANSIMVLSRKKSSFSTPA